MANALLFTSSQSSHGSNDSRDSTSPSVSIASAVSAPTPLHSSSFSIFQEGLGQPLLFAPPLGTPELRSLVDQFIALDVPESMKMDMIQRDFEAHVARTNERYKAYFVPTMSVATTSPSIFASRSNSVSGVSNAGSGSGNGSGSGSFFHEGAPIPRSSPVVPSLTTTPDVTLFPLMTPMYASVTDYNPLCSANSSLDASLLAQSSASAWPTGLITSAPSPAGIPSPSRIVRHAVAQQPQRPHLSQHRRRFTQASMQILTQTGEDITYVSGRATRTHEERESTRAVRQRGACSDCRRKKQRCSPGHRDTAATTATTVSASARVSPYAAPARSGREKEDAAVAAATQVSADKVEGKKPATVVLDPVFASPSRLRPLELSDFISSELLQLSTSSNSLDLLDDTFDWSQISPTERLFSETDLDSNMPTTLASPFPDTPAILAEAPALAQPAGAEQGQAWYYATPSMVPLTQRALHIQPTQPRRSPQPNRASSNSVTTNSSLAQALRADFEVDLNAPNSGVTATSTAAESTLRSDARQASGGAVSSSGGSSDSAPALEPVLRTQDAPGDEQSAPSAHTSTQASSTSTAEAAAMSDGRSCVESDAINRPDQLSTQNGTVRRCECRVVPANDGLSVRTAVDGRNALVDVACLVHLSVLTTSIVSMAIAWSQARSPVTYTCVTDQDGQKEHLRPGPLSVACQ